MEKDTGDPTIIVRRKVMARICGRTEIDIMGNGAVIKGMAMEY